MDNNFNLNLNLVSKELRLLLEILKLESEKSIRNELLTDIEWENFLRNSNYHRVYPVIYSKLKKIEEKSIPQHVIQVLHKEYQINTFQMLQLSAEMEQVSKLFIENQICLLFLKGPVIAKDLYGDISLRTSKDLDILISVTDLKKAEKLLVSGGYKKEEHNHVLNEWKWREHHVVYFHPKKNIQLEIHWRLQSYPTKEPSFRNLWKRKRVSTITNYPVYFLGKEDLFLYLVSHGARHGWFRLRWLLDIDQMLKKGIDVNKTKLLLKKYESLHIGGQALILTSQLLNTPIDDEWQTLISKNRSRKLAHMSLVFIRENMSLEKIMSTKYYKCYLNTLKSNTQKFLLMLISFYPRFEDTETLRLPRFLHFLYFPLRPFLWAWRKTRKAT